MRKGARLSEDWKPSGYFQDTWGSWAGKDGRGKLCRQAEQDRKKLTAELREEGKKEYSKMKLAIWVSS